MQLQLLTYQDATSYPASALNGTIANSQLASGIDATKIAHDFSTTQSFNISIHYLLMLKHN